MSIRLSTREANASNTSTNSRPPRFAVATRSISITAPVSSSRPRPPRPASDKSRLTASIRFQHCAGACSANSPTIPYSTSASGRSRIEIISCVSSNTKHWPCSSNSSGTPAASLSAFNHSVCVFIVRGSPFRAS
ncbi:hypothetical protein DO71_6085 [Burkholderia pseudomallei]|nr:hypothetical protein DO71_6085 [Burkholderia pseudomallei]